MCPQFNFLKPKAQYNCGDHISFISPFTGGPYFTLWVYNSHELTAFYTVRKVKPVIRYKEN